jgi:hypothetical protein
MFGKAIGTGLSGNFLSEIDNRNGMAPFQAFSIRNQLVFAALFFAPFVSDRLASLVETCNRLYW